MLTDVLLESSPDAKSFTCLKRCILVFSAVALMAASICGCAPASSRLLEANQDFKEQHALHARFTAGTKVQAEYLGNVDNSYIYRVKDLENRNIYVSISSQKWRKSIFTLKNPSQNDDRKGFAIFHFIERGDPKSILYRQSDEILLKKNSIYTNSQDMVSENNEYPREIYLMMYRSNYHEKDKIIHFLYIDKTVYFRQNEELKNDIEENLGMSTSDYVIHELRHFGYLITLPIDLVCSAIYSPIFILSYPARGWAIN